MVEYLIWIGGIVYIVGIFVYVAGEIEENVEFHSGGFLGLGFFTSTNRSVEPRDVRMGLLWPLGVLVLFSKGVVFVVNCLIKYFLLVCGIRYDKTIVYKIIDKWTLG